MRRATIRSPHRTCPPDEWAHSWLQRTVKAATRVGGGINQLGTAAEAELTEGDAEFDAALDGIRLGIYALILLHEEAALTETKKDPLINEWLMDIGADAIRQIREFFDRYIAVVTNPDSVTGGHVELMLELQAPAGLERLARYIQPSTTECHSESDLLFMGLVGLGVGLWIGGE